MSIFSNRRQELIGQLFDCFKSGDDAAFSLFHEACMPPLVRWVIRQGVPRSDAEVIVPETLELGYNKVKVGASIRFPNWFVRVIKKLSGKPYQAASRYWNGACDWCGASRLSKRWSELTRTMHALESMRRS
jgi:hypothetical protein